MVRGGPRRLWRTTSVCGCANSSRSALHHSASALIASRARSGWLRTSLARASAKFAMTRACAAARATAWPQASSGHSGKASRSEPPWLATHSFPHRARRKTAGQALPPAQVQCGCGRVGPQSAPGRTFSAQNVWVRVCPAAALNTGRSQVMVRDSSCPRMAAPPEQGVRQQGRDRRWGMW